ncbi:MAG TPA: cyclic 2,3-diphosphoglycerate synthase [Bacteroidales bacterium]|nr:cyclic 2,3-diphosphoglycerate synthase [Bacteroidales bacterium]
MRKRIIIIGAAGRDFHNFNMLFRDNELTEIVGFTAAQIPDIDGRKYPAELAGKLYPDGIPIFAEKELPMLIKTLKIDECLFSYSDVSYSKIMSLASVVNAAGAHFTVAGTTNTMLKSNKPVIAVGAVRTGCGKSQTSRKIAEIINQKGIRTIAIRHPMPYGDLVKQKVQRFASIEDLQKHECTVEEMEEYEPHIMRGIPIYAGVDYEAILRQAENDPKGCDVILWDGGNNDFPFINPDLMVTVLDPLRPGHEVAYYPGETTLRIANIAIINKIDSSTPENVELVKNNIAKVNPNAIVIEANSPISVENANIIKNKRVLVIEDGPTLTHGEMKIGAGIVAAEKFGASEIIDPRPYLVGKLKDTFQIYPNIGKLLPAMGYGQQQLADLEQTINNTVCDAVIVGTPINLGRIININKPYTRVSYELQEISHPDLETLLNEFLKEKHFY